MNGVPGRDGMPEPRVGAERGTGRATEATGRSVARAVPARRSVQAEAKGGERGFAAWRCIAARRLL